MEITETLRKIKPLFHIIDINVTADLFLSPRQVYNLTEKKEQSPFIFLF